MRSRHIPKKKRKSRYKNIVVENMKRRKMEHKIIPYKQSLSQSCLVACFLMLLKGRYGIKFTSRDEEKITIRSMQRKYSFYVAGVPKEIAKAYKKKIKLTVDNKYFTKVVTKAIGDEKNIRTYHQKITMDYIKRIVKENPVICHVDDHYLGDYSHASHFVIIEKTTNKKIKIIDPWTGKRRVVSAKRIEDSITSLKKHVKMCPLVYTI